jgi:phenylacetate-CoA ligase
MHIWNPIFECIDREELKKVQSERLVSAIDRVYHNVLFTGRKCRKKEFCLEILRVLMI